VRPPRPLCPTRECATCRSSTESAENAIRRPPRYIAGSSIWAWTWSQSQTTIRWARSKISGTIRTSLSVKRSPAACQVATELLRPENFRKFRANATAIDNGGVFEIPDILRGILEGVAPTPRTTASASSART